ncbi:uncharacterized protein V2V93DRAFT_342451 [Kockiozyma suomiensis]|uniref:uncharacterized protein n=1 Tax=Kockiozyma suomiensis TaxID=1337062 RepID=UPI0033437A71
MSTRGRRGDHSRNPYLDNVPLDDTNDNIFLAGSDDDDDDFFFDNSEDASDKKRNRHTTWDPAGEFRTLPDSQERIYVSKPHWGPPESATSGTNYLETAKEDIRGFSLLLLLTNGLGLESLNNQLLADSFAREGYFVVMPDLFFNDPNAPIAQPTTSLGPTSLLSRVKSLAVSSATGFKTDMWVARHTEERTWPMLVQMIDEIVDIYRPRDISVVGYSFGGKYALKLLQLPTTEIEIKERSMSEISQTRQFLPSLDTPAAAITTSTSPTSASSQSPAPFLSQPTVSSLTNPPWSSLIKTGVVAHPSLADSRDFVRLRKSVLILAVQDDPLFPPDMIASAVKALSQDTVFYDVKLFDRKLPHGFAVKGDYPLDNRLVTENQALAQRDIVSWLKSFVE